MNQKILKKILNFTLFFATCFTIIAAEDESTKNFGHNFFSNRSQGNDLPRRLAGVTPQFLVPCDTDCLNGYFAAVPSYMRSFDRDEIGDYFFVNGTNTMTFGAEAAAGIDIFGRNFYLNDQFNGLLTALPQVENFVADFQVRVNFDEWVQGLYAELYVPINWTSWKMSFDQTVNTTGQFIAANQLGNTVDVSSPIGSIKTAFNGQILSPNLPDLKQTLQYGRVSDDTETGKKSKVRVADVELAVGYNFLCCDMYHVGIDIRGIFPTGNRPESIFLFEPICGNGKRFEVGGGLNAHYEFWNNCCDSSFSVWLQGVAYHIFKGKQRRIFDLKNADGTQNVGSNRLLIKKYANNAYAGEVLFGPNVLARECKVSNSVHANLVALFDYKRCGFNLDVGYEFWVRTKDKLVITQPIPANTYGVAGDSGTTGTPARPNPNVNRTASTTTISGANAAVYDATNVYISTDSLSIDSAINPTAMSHKVFAHVSYVWDNCDYSPFVGIGGETEFSGKKNFALNQWAVWIKGGFAFS